MNKRFQIVVTLILLILFITGCNMQSSSKNSTDILGYDSNNQSLKPSPTTGEPQTSVTPAEKNTFVLLKTTLGDVEIELFNTTMPITAGNFEKLVKEGFYDGVIFHRVIPGFMAQGGDPTGTGMGGPGYTIDDEFTDQNSNDRGTLSMANAGPDTGGSQFFINVVDNNFLDSKHPVFGKVTKGLDIVDKMVAVKRDPMDKPLEDIVIKKAEIVKK